MTAVPQPRGTAAIPQAESTIPPSSTTDMERALGVLAEKKEAWVALDLEERIALLRRLRRDTWAVADRWVARALEAKGIEPGSGGEGEEWLGGPFALLRNLRLFQESLEQIREHGRPVPPGPITTLDSGQVSVGVFPVDVYDKLFYRGFSGEVRMQPGVTEQNLSENQARIYRKKASGEPVEGKVALVLGAGNVSSIGPMDVLYKLFVEDQVCVLKMNPVNEYLGPFVDEAFQALVEQGFVRVVYGGADEGKFLCQHDLVDEIHITGSDKTHDAIVFGPGPDGERRKRERDPLHTKRITSELGNVSPIIVVPGPWKKGDLEFQAANLASSLANNAGFNCNATRVIVTHRAWEQRKALLDGVRKVLDETPWRRAYYPGAEDRWKLFKDSHPDAETLGREQPGGLPWTLMADLDPDAQDDPAFTTEAFCGVFGEMPLEASSVAEYVDRAVAFCNDRLWGTLNAAILVHPDSLEDPQVKEAVDRAVDDLHYGAVAVNHWPALAYALVTTTWGAYPGHDIYDIQSGVGVVHNSFLFDKPEKSVVRGPFRINPTPPWFVTNRNSARIARKLAAFEANPSWLEVPGIILGSLKG
ncbi:MAG: aldehyde dehydrogenase family protein [Myxococcota bacterium]